MVFEQIIKERWLEEKGHSFFLGFFYSLIGIFSSLLIFPASVDMMSIAFTSILLIPSLAALLRLEENLEIREKKFSIQLLIKDHKDIFKTYVYLFLGIFFAYFLVTVVLPEALVFRYFESQLDVAGLTGFAAFSAGLKTIILNNLLIFVVCFVLSLAYGAGALIFLTWNASVWGVVFAFLFVSQSTFSGLSPISAFFLVLPVLPHLITESIAYISASIAGGVISKAILREKIMSRQFKHILTDAMIILVVGFLAVIIAGFIEMI